MPRSLVKRSAAILGSMVAALVTLPSAGQADSFPFEQVVGAQAATRPTLPAPPINVQCQTAIKIAGSIATQGPYAELQAHHNAIQSWRAQVAEKHGHDFAQWWRAKDKDVTCRQIAGSMRCEARATPCMAPPGIAAPVLSGLGIIERR